MVFTVTDAVNRYVESRQSVREPDGKFHPSALYGCLRQAVYQYRGTPETNPRDDRSKRTLWLGTQYHEWVQAAIAEHPEIVESYAEVHIDVPELNIVGDADIVYRTAEAGWELGEVKSIGTFALKAAGNDLPKPDHEGQALTYLYALRTHGSVAKQNCEKHPPRHHTIGLDGEIGVENTCPVLPPFGDTLSRICFAYVAKDNLTPHEFFVKWTPKAERLIHQKIEDLSAYVNDGNSLPPRLPFGGKKMDRKNLLCNYCPFSDRCWQDDPDEVPPEASVW